MKATVRHALEAGFEVTVLREAIAAVDVQPGDGERALEEMTRAGARVVRAMGQGGLEPPSNRL